MAVSGGAGDFDSSYGLTRHLNCLQDQNRHTRRQALDAIRNELFSDGQTNDRVAPECGVVETLIRSLLRAFSDPVERCRELAILTVGELMESTQDPSSLLQCVIPTLVQSLAQPEITEPSEELRLKLVQLMHSVVQRCGVHVAPYLHDLVQH